MKEKKRKKRNKRLFIFGGIAVFILVLFVGAVEFTSHSGFCASCHYMKPFFESWETSSHSEFECSACHYPPSGGIRSVLRKKIEGLVMVGRYWTKLYVKSKPWAEIRDESCLAEGCHDKRLLEGKAQFKKVAFDHKIHFEDLKRGKRLQCTSCHSQIVQGEHITVTESSCFICHFKESEHYPQIDDCSHCHTKDILVNSEESRFNHSLVFEKEFACDKCHSNTIIGDGEVPRENCYKCHWERERLEQYEDTDLMHTEHIFEDKIECNLCHMEIQHKIIKDIEAISDCKTCHTDFHKPQKILYTGEGGKGVSHPMPNMMLEKGLSCKGCHIFHEEANGDGILGETFVSEGEACESCHGKGFSRILADWEASTLKKLTKIRSIFSSVMQIVESSRHANKKKAESLMEEALFNIEIVDKGKSVHNVAYSQELLFAAYNKMTESLNTIESRYRPPQFEEPAKNIPTQCSNCHQGIEEISTSVFGLNFPHKNHLIEQNIQCDTCHSNIRQHGEFIATKQGCASCHHKDPEKDCTKCHQLQKTIYQGGILNGEKVPEDIMFEAGAECTDCHLNDQNIVFRSTAKKCLDCHEEEYEEMFTEWRASVRDLLASLTSLLKEKKERALTEQEKMTLQEAERTLHDIQLDGSTGIHNYIYVEEVLTGLVKQLESLG
ncbi:MAG: cytochrome c3 family protein [Candidatus Aminicenantes bacterium]|jgi:nitrate/TMAO reductase-like tetraheme cytochrome c subunit